MNAALAQALIERARNDLAVRQGLLDAGELPRNAYHPAIRAIHEVNARFLSTVLDAHGWPGVSLVGDDGCEAAWLIAQHSVGDLPFLRRCRDLLADAVDAEDAPLWQLAYLADRIAWLEGRPQRFGTQWHLPEGADVSELWDVDEPEGLDERRRTAGLPSIEETRRRIHDEDRRLRAE